ncbi:MAG: transglycosylase SLT domain-containing protein [Deltaproteobacteria bacterium]
MAFRTLIMTVVAAGLVLAAPAAHAGIAIDLNAIEAIESGGDPNAVNVATGCYGICQISQICLQDYNQFHGTRYAVKDLFRPEINERIARWYFQRIEQMLIHSRIPVTLTTVIASYNWGIGNVAEWARQGMRFEDLPAETRRYIGKYRALTRPA